MSWRTEEDCHLQFGLEDLPLLPGLCRSHHKRSGREASAAPLLWLWGPVGFHRSPFFLIAQMRKLGLKDL